MFYIPFGRLPAVDADCDTGVFGINAAIKSLVTITNLLPFAFWIAFMDFGDQLFGCQLLKIFRAVSWKMAITLRTALIPLRELGPC